MKKILEKDSLSKIFVSTFRGNHPFVVAGKNEFDKITKIIEVYRHSSQYASALMNRKENILVEVLDMENFAGMYTDNVIFMNKDELNNERDFFQSLIHEYIHYLQDLTLNIFGKETNYKNTVQDFYICMVSEADAFTKEQLIFENKLNSNDMNEIFLNQIKHLATKINYSRYYHYDFKYLKMKMNADVKHSEFKSLLKSLLSSGTVLQKGAFPVYTFTFDELSKILDEAIVENKEFEMLAKVNHWSEDETRLRLLDDPFDYRKNDDEEWKTKLHNFCMTAQNKRPMNTLLRNIKVKEL